MPDYDYQSDSRPFSRVLEDIGARDEPRLYLGELVNAFGERAFGALMLFLGLLSAAIGAIPGTTTVIGLPLLLISVQLVLRRDQLWFPRAALSKSFDRANYRRGLDRFLKPLRIVERISRPRLSVMSSEAGETLIGVMSAVLCLILMLPLIFANLIPSLAIAAFGFGLMQRDGLAILAGWALSAGFMVFLWLAWEVVSRAVLATWGWWTGLIG